jgi:hypothetical protein
VRSIGHAGGRRPGAGALAVLVVLSGIDIGCADYKQTRAATSSISDVRVTTSRGEIGDCRLIGGVDSRDTARGCGLTVQPTPEECLKYQVRFAGGDTLLRRGPAGDAYDCSRPSAAPPEAARATQTPSTPPAPHAETPPPKSAVRIVLRREMAKGCVYLDEVDLKAACRDELGKAPEDCVADRATEAGGNMVFLDGGRAQIFSCRATP